jgi:hypothetical protein
VTSVPVCLSKYVYDIPPLSHVGRARGSTLVGELRPGEEESEAPVPESYSREPPRPPEALATRGALCPAVGESPRLANASVRRMSACEGVTK